MYVALIPFPRTLVRGTEFNFRFFLAYTGVGEKLGIRVWICKPREIHS